LEITKTVLSLMLVVITMLTTLTTIAAYAVGDGNGQKAETESSESLTLGGLSPQGEDDLAIACSVLPEQC
jgi:Na+-driven multidrug efflux pump